MSSLSYWMKVQYIPDSVADERINIGIVVADDNAVSAQFLERWERVEAFSDVDVSFLREWAAHFLAGLPNQSLKRLQKEAENIYSTVQISRPLPSILPIEELLNDLAPRVLMNSKRKP